MQSSARRRKDIAADSFGSWKMEGKREEMIRKGPWKVEEDEVLLNHVKKHGARDWSSIRAKGLLQRTGKSCRLRYVNKLRPNLKNGCKFSMEEERVVIELQAEFGNKWARIATYLPGRTDNDVKNFWSSRQKRLARTMNGNAASSATSKPNKAKKQKTPYFQGSMFSSPVEEGEETSSLCFHKLQPIKTVPFLDFVKQELPTDLLQMDGVLVEQKKTQPPLQQAPQLEISDLSFSTEYQDYLDRLANDHCLLSNLFSAADSVPLIDRPQFAYPIASLIGTEMDANSLTTPDTFFDDFPADMFDHIEPLPSPSRW